MEYIGSPRTDVAWRAAIIIQGPYHGYLTIDNIGTFLARNTDILVIVSTYSVVKITPIEQYWIDEGHLVYIIIKEPSVTLVDFWRTNRWNQNLQRLSSYIGLEYANSHHIEYSLKIRSDMCLEREDVIEYLRDQIDHCPLIPRDRPSWAQMPPHGEMKARIAITGHGTFNHSDTQPYPYHIRDFWFFGHTTDLMRYFDISEDSGWQWGSGMPTLLAPESNLAIRWMDDMYIIASDTMDLVSRYFVIFDPDDVDSQRMNTKQMSYDEYVKARKNGPVYQWITEQEPERIITRKQWSELVSKLLE